MREHVLGLLVGSSLSIMGPGVLRHRIIEKDTALPTSRSHVFTNSQDNQSSVCISVLLDEDELLAVFAVTDLRPAPRGEVEVEVAFRISAVGVVSVTAHDQETGLEQSLAFIRRPVST